MVTTRIILVRHGQPVADTSGRCYGRLDVALSPHGFAQARIIAERLAHEPLAAIYASPRRRTVDTAGAIADLHGLSATVNDDLREIDFGDFEGRTYDEIAAQYPELYRQWMEQPTTVQFPSGERFTDLRNRAVHALDGILRQHAGSTVSIVTHGGVCRAIIASALQMPDEAIFRLDQPYCACTTIDWLDGTPVLRAMAGEPAVATSTGR